MGSWSNPDGAQIELKEGGSGLISKEAQLQVSGARKEGEPDGMCEFSWGVDRMPGGKDTWVSITYPAGRCGFSGPGRFGLHYYYGESEELLLAPVVEFPEPDEIYSRTATAKVLNLIG
ncbi:hypothetical protein [Streptomyces tsukubensis]|uniref:hypothetical protein n=1 Tax=Streptomyces tsukubensis TaxID=83656 RepID=UPI00344F358E